MGELVLVFVRQFVTATWLLKFFVFLPRVWRFRNVSSLNLWIVYSLNIRNTNTTWSRSILWQIPAEINIGATERFACWAKLWNSQRTLKSSTWIAQITVSVSKLIFTHYWKEICWSQMLWRLSLLRVQLFTFKTDEQFDRNFSFGTQMRRGLWRIVILQYSSSQTEIYYLSTQEFVLSAWIEVEANTEEQTRSYHNIPQ